MAQFVPAESQTTGHDGGLSKDLTGHEGVEDHTGEITRQLAYKCRWYGRNYIEIDRWFPSSKRCSPEILRSEWRESETFPINSSLFWQEYLGEEKENESFFLLEG